MSLVEVAKLGQDVLDRINRSNVYEALSVLPTASADEIRTSAHALLTELRHPRPEASPVLRDQLHLTANRVEQVTLLLLSPQTRAHHDRCREQVGAPLQGEFVGTGSLDVMVSDESESVSGGERPILCARAAP